MTILVTGGAGFIGSNLVHRLLAGPDAPTVVTLDKLTYAGREANLGDALDDPAHTLERADICDAAEVERVFRTHGIGTVYHLAAESHVDRSIESGQVFVETNVVGTQVLLDAARRHDVERFVHVSTDEVYGSIDEGAFTETDALEPSSPYSASKAGSDLVVQAHVHTYGLPAVITRCTNNYGPRQHAEKLLPKVITNALRDEPIPLYGDGLNVRDWLYVEDHCKAVEVVASRGETGEVYNIGADDERTNLDLVRTVLDHLGKAHDLIEFVEDRPGHDRRYALDCTKVRALDWAPSTPFKDGLAATVDWYTRTGARP